MGGGNTVQGGRIVLTEKGHNRCQGQLEGGRGKIVRKVLKTKVKKKGGAQRETDKRVHRKEQTKKRGKQETAPRPRVWMRGGRCGRKKGKKKGTFWEEVGEEKGTTEEIHRGRRGILRKTASWQLKRKTLGCDKSIGGTGH